MDKSTKSKIYSKSYNDKNKLLSGLRVVGASEITIKDENKKTYELDKEYIYYGKIDNSNKHIVINANARFKNNNKK